MIFASQDQWPPCDLIAVGRTVLARCTAKVVKWLDNEGVDARSWLLGPTWPYEKDERSG